MKYLQTTVTKVLLAGALATGMFVTGSVSADTAGSGAAYLNTMLLASTDFKGEHPNNPHVVYERRTENKQLVRAEGKSGVSLVSFRGKPPYNRHTTKMHELEKVQFARLEEGGAAKHEHNIYRGSQGMHPPYKRN